MNRNEIRREIQEVVDLFVKSHRCKDAHDIKNGNKYYTEACSKENNFLNELCKPNQGLVVSEGFLNWLDEKADDLENIAAQSGAMHDGGAKHLRDLIDLYRSAINGEIPDIWKEYQKEFEKLNDPEYQTYLKLKKKFET